MKLTVWFRCSWLEADLRRMVLGVERGPNGRLCGRGGRGAAAQGGEARAPSASN